MSRHTLRLSILFVLSCWWGHSSPALGQEVFNRRQQQVAASLSHPQGVYRHYCAHCHGGNAQGRGRLWVEELSPKPTNLRKLAQQKKKQYFVEAISHGSSFHRKTSYCPPWKYTLSKSTIERLAFYLQSFSKKGKKKPKANPVRKSPSSSKKPVKKQAKKQTKQAKKQTKQAKKQATVEKVVSLGHSKMKNGGKGKTAGPWALYSLIFLEFGALLGLFFFARRKTA